MKGYLGRPHPVIVVLFWLGVAGSVLQAAVLVGRAVAKDSAS